MRIRSEEAVACARWVHFYRSQKVRYLPGALNRILFATQGRSYKNEIALAQHLETLVEAEEMTRWYFPHLYEDWRPWTK
jgi:hypothetical protein